MANKKKAKHSMVNAHSIDVHHEKLEELSNRVHAALVDLNLADEEDPPPGCHWEFRVTPAGVKKTLVCPIG